MHTICCMDRKLSKDNRLSADSLYEVKDAAEKCAKELGRTIKFNGQRLSLQALMNAIVLDLLSKTREEQLAIVGAGIDRLNALLDSESEVSLPIHGQADRQLSLPPEMLLNPQMDELIRAGNAVVGKKGKSSRKQG